MRPTSLHSPSVAYAISSVSLIDDIEQEMSSVESEIVRFKPRRNALVPIGRLPSDILVDIFIPLRDGNDSDFTLFSGEIYLFASLDGDWSRIMLVCAQFRALALCTPALWNTLDLTKWQSPRRAAWRELCMARSQNSPLRLRTN
jgi:hypothetical protein